MTLEQYNQVFADYAAAFNERDTDRIMDLFVFPVELKSEGKTYRFKDRAAFLDNLYKLFSIYRKLGISSALFRLREDESNHKTALINWTMLDSENRKVLDFSTRYRFHRRKQLIDGIETCDEPEKLRRLLGSEITRPPA